MDNRPVDTPDTRTYRLLVAYDGTRFKGWQRGNGRTVQGTLEEALGRSLPEASRGAVAEDHQVIVVGSGRTDAGVHAEGQVASVVLPAALDVDLLLPAVNRHLPSDVAVRCITAARERFHARYHATARTYRYRIDDGPVGNPFLRSIAWRTPERLDIERMRAASEGLIGTHDFASFTADRGKSNTTRTVHSIRIDRCELFGDPVLELFVRGDGFLWKQVRIMVGSLVAASRGELDAEAIGRIITARDRSLAPPPAPACGLTLLEVEYPDSDGSER